MAKRRRRSGKRCLRKKRVRIRGGGTAMRCAKFAGSRSSGRKRSRSRRRRGRKPAGMAKRGSTCVSFKRVRVKGGGTQRRCRKFRA
jgi:NADPH-dependent glutamate synthase beta subunit-like oxidoreductase